MADDKTKEILLPTGSEIVLRSGQAELRVTFNAVNGSFDVRGNRPAYVHLPVGQDEQLVRPPRIGEEVEHGWKYGGISPSTKFPLFVASKDEPYLKQWKWAVEDAAGLRNFNGHAGSRQQTQSDVVESVAKGTHDHGVRVPTFEELHRNIYPVRDLIGSFDGLPRQGSQFLEGRYWSSKANNSGDATCVNFLSEHQPGIKSARRQSQALCVRLIRT